MPPVRIKATYSLLEIEAFYLPHCSLLAASPEHSGSIMGIQAEEESYPDEDSVDGSQPTKVTSMLPTMWLGAQSGK